MTIFSLFLSFFFNCAIFLQRFQTVNSKINWIATCVWLSSVPAIQLILVSYFILFKDYQNKFYFFLSHFNFASLKKKKKLSGFWRLLIFIVQIWDFFPSMFKNSQTYLTKYRRKNLIINNFPLPRTSNSSFSPSTIFRQNLWKIILK